MATSPYRAARKFPLRLSLGLLALIVALLTGLHALRIMAVSYGLTQHHPPKLVDGTLSTLQNKFTVHENSIQGRQGALAVRLFEPAGHADAPTVVVVHGFAPDGFNADSINEIARVLAEYGFRVVVPNIPAETGFLMRRQALYELGDAVHWAAHQYGGPVSVFGFSFSGGLIMALATTPEFGPDIKLVFSVAGYNSLPRVGEFYLRQHPADPSGAPNLNPPRGGAPLVMAWQYLDEMVPAADYAAIHDAMYQELIFQRETPAGQAVFARLTPAQSRIYQTILDSNTPEMLAEHHRLIQEHLPEFDGVSPHGKLGSVQCPVYEMHGKDDTEIPEAETLWTAHELPSNNQAHVLITPALLHIRLNHYSSFHDKIRVGLFVSSVMQAVTEPQTPCR